MGVRAYDANYAGTDRRTQSARGRRRPSMGNRVYTVGGAGQVACASNREHRTGSGVDEVWQHDLISEFDATMPQWGVACSPLVEGDLVIVQPGGKRGAVVAFDKTTGETEVEGRR